MDKLSISVPENALNNNAVCGFDLDWITDDSFRGSALAFGL